MPKCRCRGGQEHGRIRARHGEGEWDVLAEPVDLHVVADGGHKFLRSRPTEAADVELQTASLCIFDICRAHQPERTWKCCTQPWQHNSTCDPVEFPFCASTASAMRSAGPRITGTRFAPRSPNRDPSLSVASGCAT